jgi:ATP-dependent Clp protease, protease subunit
LSFNVHKREEDKILASDRYNKVYRFIQEINDVTVADCMMILSRWSRLDPTCQMEVVFCCPGGSIVDGFALYDFIQDLKRKGHKIITKSIGYAASMAGVLLQAGSERIMGDKSWLLIHETSFGAQGKVGVVDDTVDWIKRMADHVVDIFAEKAAAKTGKTEKQIKAFIRKNWNRKDWWISSKEALEYGFCDRIE